MTSLNIDSALNFWATANTASHSMLDVEGSRQRRRHASRLTDAALTQEVTAEATAGTKTVQ
jgi:hypothetical protein